MNLDSPEKKLSTLVELILNPTSEGRTEIERPMLIPNEIVLRFNCYNREHEHWPYFSWIGPEKDYHTALQKAINERASQSLFP